MSLSATSAFDELGLNHFFRLVIGLFGLVGVLGVFTAPLIGRTIDHLVPWFATVIATIGLIVFQAIQTGAGGINIAAVVIVCFGLDVFRQYQQVSLTTAVFGIEPSARSRLNAVVWLSVRTHSYGWPLSHSQRVPRFSSFPTSTPDFQSYSDAKLGSQVFIGQIMGTAVGTQVFIKYGWRPAAALSIAWSGFTLFVMLIRGPHCKRYTWIGYEGGLELRKSRLTSPQQQQQPDPEKGELGVEVVMQHVHITVDVDALEDRPQAHVLPYSHEAESAHGGVKGNPECQGTTAYAEHREGKPTDDHDHREENTSVNSHDIRESMLLSPSLSDSGSEGRVPAELHMGSVELQATVAGE